MDFWKAIDKLPVVEDVCALCISMSLCLLLLTASFFLFSLSLSVVLYACDWSCVGCFLSNSLTGVVTDE